jgi:hypothetical protein
MLDLRNLYRLRTIRGFLVAYAGLDAFMTVTISSMDTLRLCLQLNKLNLRRRRSMYFLLLCYFCCLSDDNMIDQLNNACD